MRCGRRSTSICWRICRKSNLTQIIRLLSLTQPWIDDSRTIRPIPTRSSKKRISDETQLDKESNKMCRVLANVAGPSSGHLTLDRPTSSAFTSSSNVERSVDSAPALVSSNTAACASQNSAAGSSGIIETTNSPSLGLSASWNPAVSQSHWQLPTFGSPSCPKSWPWRPIQSLPLRSVSSPTISFDNNTVTAPAT